MLFQHIAPFVLLAASNVFMISAWYWHLKFDSMPLLIVIAISWGLALVEYCLAVPANRIGYSVYSAAELRTIQVGISLVIFTGFAVFYLGEKIHLGQLAGFALMIAGAYLVFSMGGASEKHEKTVAAGIIDPDGAIAKKIERKS